MSDDEEERKPSWKDYIAIIIAMLTTNLLPIVILTIFLIVITVILTHIF
jgi:hypothetical protein